MFELFTNPMFSDLNRLRREVDSFFARPDQRSGIRASQTARYPQVSIGETETEIRVNAFAPGLDRTHLDVAVQGNLLRISGKYSEKINQTDTQTKEELQLTRHRTERPRGMFSRVLTLPDTVSPPNAQATYEDGILSVVLAKKPELQPQRIEVKF